MDDVGKILKNKREQKNLTLFDISKELKISQEILSNIENNYFQKDINSIFIIGHLKSYCLFLDLNYIEIVKLFKKQHLPEEKKNIEIERPKFEYKILFSNKLISFSLILGIFGAFYFLFIEVEKPSKEFALIPDLPENYNSIIEKANLDDLTINKKTVNKSENNLIEIENITNSSSAIASLPRTEENKSRIITLKFLDDTWVQLRDQNDEIIFSQLMNKDDEYSYDLLANYSITSGNAGHILVLIDQKVRGKVGKKGQVVDSLVISKDFNN